ncbi:MAG: ATP-binding protein [Hyphomicrobiaceae bacterium]|nr:HAMP domain-containing protein [Hyphomicrobiaceae bacterium]
MSRSFDTLAARAILVSLFGITLVHFLSLWTYEQALDRELTRAHETRLAERIVTIKRSIMLVPPAQREAVAHGLSGGPVDVHWSLKPGAVAGGAGVEEWQGLVRQISTLSHDIAASDVVIGTSAGADPHVALVSMRLPDDSWINVSMFAVNRLPSSPHGTVVSTTLMALGVILLSILIARWLTRPIRDVSAAARSHAPDGTPLFIRETGPEEVRDLAKAFNDMQRRIADLIERRTQSLAAVSHDLRTPLTRLKLRLEDFHDETMRAAIAADIGEMEQMIDTTLSYLRGDEKSEVPRPLDLTALLETIVNDACDGGGDVAFEMRDHIVVDGRLVGLKRAFNNLVSNAIRFGTSVTVSSTCTDEVVKVLIDDNGPGVSESQISVIFEPFVRLDQSRNQESGGVGLGLTIAKDLIEADGGSIALTNRREGGLRATVTLPLRRS